MPAAQVLLRVAETVCGPQARHVVFDALVADLDREWRDTRGVGRIALVFTGALAYLRSIFLCIDVTHAMAVMPRVTWSVVLLLFGLAGAAIALQPLQYSWVGIGVRFLWLPSPPNLFLLPKAIAHTLAFAVLPAMLIATCAGWSWRRRLGAVGAAIVVFVTVDGHATIPEVIAATQSSAVWHSLDASNELGRKRDELLALLAFAAIGTGLGRAANARKLHPRGAALVGWWLFAWVTYRALEYCGDFLLAMLGLSPDWQEWVAPTMFVALAAALVTLAASTPRAAPQS
jgi:hypothetical protein